MNRYGIILVNLKLVSAEDYWQRVSDHLTQTYGAKGYQIVDIEYSPSGESITVALQKIYPPALVGETRALGLTRTTPPSEEVALPSELPRGIAPPGAKPRRKKKPT